MKRALRAVWHWRNDMVSRIVWFQPMAAAARLKIRQPTNSSQPNNGSRDPCVVTVGGAPMITSGQRNPRVVGLWVPKGNARTRADFSRSARAAQEADG